MNTTDKTSTCGIAVAALLLGNLLSAQAVEKPFEFETPESQIIVVFMCQTGPYALPACASHSSAYETIEACRAAVIAGLTLRESAKFGDPILRIWRPGDYIYKCAPKSEYISAGNHKYPAITLPGVPVAPWPYPF
jgi:hypothetical protein